MAATTLGDLLGSASGHLDATVRFSRARRPAEVLAAASGEASRVVTALSRYLDDLIPFGQYEAVVVRDTDPLLRTVADARGGLEIAAAGLAAVAAAYGELGEGPGSTDPLVTHLAGAASALTAGHDLLATHFIQDADGPRAGYSDWPDVIGSGPFIRALLTETAGWSHRISVLASRLTPTAAKGPGVPEDIHRGLAGASHWLLTASAALGSCCHDGPAETAGRTLLRAVPSSALPSRQLLGEAETMTGLCGGIAISAVRSRHAAREMASQADTYQGEATAASWRWTATAAAVICDITEITVSSIATTAGQTTGRPASAGQLHTAASAADRACRRWHEVATAWGELQTESRGLNVPGVADTGDLVIRLGRLASGDPRWTPSRALSVWSGSQARLAGSRKRSAAVVAAVHQAAETLVCIATADLDAVKQAASDSRLHAPTRTLPDDRDIPHPFGTPESTTVVDLLAAYRAAITASTQLALTLDAVAITLDAPSAMLAAARAVTAPHVADAYRAAAPEPAGPAGAALDLADRSELRTDGPVGQAIRRRGTSDPTLVLRAAAVDKVARQLLAEAEQSPRKPRATRQSKRTASKDMASTDEAGVAAALAAESFPAPPGAPAKGRLEASRPASAPLPAPRRDPPRVG